MRGTKDRNARYLSALMMKIEVIEITDMWIEEGYSDRYRRTFFRIKGDDGYIHVIWHDEKSLEWFLKIK